MESLEKEKQGVALGWRQSAQGLIQLKGVNLTGLVRSSRAACLFEKGLVGDGCKPR